MFGHNGGSGIQPLLFKINKIIVIYYNMTFKIFLNQFIFSHSYYCMSHIVDIIMYTKSKYHSLIHSSRVSQNLYTDYNEIVN